MKQTRFNSHSLTETRRHGEKVKDQNTVLDVPPCLRASVRSLVVGRSLVPARLDCGPLLFFVSSVERFCLSTAVFRFIAV